MSVTLVLGNNASSCISLEASAVPMYNQNFLTSMLDQASSHLMIQNGKLVEVNISFNKVDSLIKKLANPQQYYTSEENKSSQTSNSHLFFYISKDSLGSSPAVYHNPTRQSKTKLVITMGSGHLTTWSMKHFLPLQNQGISLSLQFLSW